MKRKILRAITLACFTAAFIANPGYADLADTIIKETGLEKRGIVTPEFRQMLNQAVQESIRIKREVDTCESKYPEEEWEEKCDPINDSGKSFVYKKGKFTVEEPEAKEKAE